MSSELGTKEFESIIACPKCGREIEHICAIFGCNMEKVIISGEIRPSDQRVLAMLYHYDTNKPLEYKGPAGSACFFCSGCYMKYSMGKGKFDGFIAFQEIENLKKIVQRGLQ